jgi:hypothetical protein
MSIFCCAIVTGHLDPRSSETKNSSFDVTNRLLLVLNFLHEVVEKKRISSEWNNFFSHVPKRGVLSVMLKRSDTNSMILQKRYNVSNIHSKCIFYHVNTEQVHDARRIQLPQSKFHVRKHLKNQWDLP